LRAARTDYRGLRSAAALVQSGFEVTLVDIEVDHLRPAEEDIAGVHVKHIIMPNWQSSRRFELWFFITAVRTFILSLFWLLRTPADIYHATEVTALPACCIAAWLRRKPLIFEAYELPPPDTSVAFWRLLSGVLVYLLAIILPRCAGVITASPLYAREIRKRFHVTHVSLVRNMPEYRSVPKSDRLRQALGLGADTQIALYQGNIDHLRGLDRLVRAGAFLKQDVVIVLMGKATNEQLQTIIEQEELRDRVKILPPVPYEELLDWTASADIGLNVLLPDRSRSVQLSLPNKVFEYLMAGLPVLTSALEAVVGVVKAYEVGDVVYSSTPQDIGRAINTLLSDQAKLAHMRSNALNAAQDLCWEKERGQLIQLYKKVCSKIDVKTVRR
jgi:glycosyltransferase involved in cell wall biosynthesis